jgi:prephenate dehydrogenase
MSMTVGIVGLGLIGGSLAKAYKAAGAAVLGFDRDVSVTELARIAGAIDEPLTPESEARCDLLLLAVAPAAACAWLEAEAPRLSTAALVMDCCGVKQAVCETGFRLAAQYGFEFAGGHPMAGTHHWGFGSSRADLFQGASFVAVPRTFDDMALLERIRQAVLPAGFGSVSVTTAAQHDKLIAFTSQLAHVVSSAYIKSPTALEHRGFSAGSYQDLTRVAWLNPVMWTELFLDNREQLLPELDGLITRLEQYRSALSDRDGDALCALLDEGARRKQEVDGA